MHINLNLLRSFVAVAEHGSLTAAARVLRISQPTLSRHVAELEEHLGVRLFERHPRGLQLTARGTELYTAAAEVVTAAETFGRRAAGLAEAPEGTVRLTAPDVVAHFVLPEVLAELRASHPAIALELVTENRVANLLRRDADIAVRMFRPEQPDLITRKVAEVSFALYASRAYVDRFGAPTVADLADPLGGHTFIGLDRDDVHLRGLAAAGVQARREDFTMRSDSQSFSIHAVVAGVGVTAIQEAVAERLGLVRLQGDVFPSIDVWLTAHEDLRRNPHIRVVYDRLAAFLGAFYDTV